MNTIHNTIKTLGGRLTKTRKAIIEVLSENRCFLTKAEIIQKLRDKKIKPDRTTLYRELVYLTKNQIARKNTINGIEYFEIPQDHHHHLVCVSCNSIQSVDMSNHLEKQEKQIAKQNKFNIINHSLEFYGYCHNCQA
ncbi:MAG: Fur family transcriptional regulator, ferric uptake regulator [Parcubacteria group bacterium Athens0714_26]|nr:MAG: Fur family transcriptional regulator, ferric uptake regulator [Parcubacteria group bacterium Athens0714_26]